MAAVADTHLEDCAHCRRQLADAEHVGGVLLSQQQPVLPEPQRSQRLREDMLARLGLPLPRYRRRGAQERRRHRAARGLERGR